MKIGARVAPTPEAHLQRSHLIFWVQSWLIQHSYIMAHRSSRGRLLHIHPPRYSFHLIHRFFQILPKSKPVEESITPIYSITITKSSHELSPRSMLFSSTTALSLLPYLSLLTPILAAPAPTATTNSGPTLVKRYTADDATDPAKVKEWMNRNIDPINFVFYSDSSVGAPMAKAFCDANDEEGYKYFWYIFDDLFSQDFGGADPNADTEIAEACSQAMGEYAEGDTRVFNNAGGK